MNPVLRKTRLALSGSVLAVWLALGTNPAMAQAVGPVQVDVVDRHTGRPLPVYQHGGEWWVEGQPGTRYGVRISNRSGQRLLAVMSVDGVNVLTGETAGSDQAGYVLDPRQSSQINGWRKSSQEVAAFHFTEHRQAYATRTGRPHDVGVIGVAVFQEQRRRPPRVQPRHPGPMGELHEPSPSAAPSVDRSAEVAAADSARSPARTSPSLGTGHGPRESSQSHETQFERASTQPMAVLQLRYDSRDNLIAMGVIAAPWPQPPARPQAFPSDAPRHVPDPPALRH